MKIQSVFLTCDVLLNWISVQTSHRLIAWSVLVTRACVSVSGSNPMAFNMHSYSVSKTSMRSPTLIFSKREGGILLLFVCYFCSVMLRQVRR